MKETTVISAGFALVEHYEALRKDVVAFQGHSHRVHGLALLMRKGMAAWIRGVGELPASLAASAPLSTAISLPIGVEQRLVDILATMALASASEGFA